MSGHVKPGSWSEVEEESRLKAALPKKGKIRHVSVQPLRMHGLLFWEIYLCICLIYGCYLQCEALYKIIIIITEINHVLSAADDGEGSLTPFIAAADGAPSSCISATSTSRAAFWFNQDRYVCHPTAIHPANTFRNCGGTYMKLNAVTAGQSLTLLVMLTGRAFFRRSKVSSNEAPLRSEWTLKK